MKKWPGLSQSIARDERAVLPWVEVFGRAGLAAKGLVYALVGLLALRLAIGHGGSRAASGQQDALAHLARAPFGRWVLMVLGVGLFGYALFRALGALLDPDGIGRDRKSVLKRLLYAASAVVYGGLGVSAFRLVAGQSERNGEASTRAWTALLMEQPLGRWLVGIVGVCVVGAAVAQWVRAWRATFMRHVRTEQMSARARQWVERLGRVGHAARGVVFAIAGGFLLLAAYHVQPGEARGLGGALSSLAQQRFGPVLLVTVALGLTAYGAYAVALARCRQVPVDG